MTHPSFDLRTDFHTIASARECPQAPANCLKHILQLGSIGLLLLLLTGCGTLTLFQSSFNTNTVGAPPAPNQATGTIDVSGAPGSVVIVSAPPGATGNWARIQRIGPQAPITVMQCNFSQFKGDGSYTLLAVLFIPSGSGLATVEFDTFAQANPPSTGFLHLDFMQNNTVRINDDSGQVFGTFPRDHFFTLAVNLEITSSSAVAHMNLFGAGASGTKDFNIVTNATPLFLARQFGAVKFWMGFPWNGSFEVTDILVTRKN